MIQPQAEIFQDLLYNNISTISNIAKQSDSKLLKLYYAKAEFQPSGAGGACLLPATPHHLQNQKLAPEGPKMANGVWKRVHPWTIGCSKQLSQDRF